MPFFVVNCNFCFNMQVVPAILRDSPSLSVNNTATQPNAPSPAAYLHGYQSPAGATAAASPPPLPARGAQQRAPATALSRGIATAATCPPRGTQRGRTGCSERPPQDHSIPIQPRGIPSVAGSNTASRNGLGQTARKAPLEPDQAGSKLC